MGMDLYGKDPQNEAGRYFRANVWSWHPIWNYCTLVAPEITSKVKHGHTNDGDGLNGHDSVLLCAVLKSKLKSGEVDAFLRAEEARLAAIPPEPCTICGATGKRLPPPNVGPGNEPCNGCGGKGTRASFETCYSFSKEHLAEFADFLASCGGFRIN